MHNNIMDQQTCYSFIIYRQAKIWLIDKKARKLKQSGRDCPTKPLVSEVQSPPSNLYSVWKNGIYEQ